MNTIAKLRQQVRDLRQNLKEKDQMLQQQAAERAVLEASLQQLNQEVEQRLQERTAQFTHALSELQQTQVELIRSEERYRSLVTATAQGVWVADRDGQLVETNLDIQKITGLSTAELAGWQWLSAVHPADQARVQQAWSQAFTQRDLYEVEYRLRTADGSYSHFMVRGVPVLEADQQIREWVGTITDITEQKQAEAELNRTNSELQTIFTALPDLYFRMDLSGTILDYKASQVSKLYAAPETFLNRSMAEVLPPEVGEQFKQAVQIMLQERSLVTMEYELQVPGGLCTFEARLVPLEDEQLIAIVRDITERKQIETELQQKQAQYRSIFESATDALHIFDMETGVLVEANPAACRMHGYSYEEFLSLPPGAFVHPDYHSLFGEFIETVKAGREFYCEAVNLHRDGTLIDINVKGTGFLYNGKPHVLSVVRDIREAKRAEIQRKQAEIALRESEERYRLMFETHPTPMVVHSLDELQFLAVNQAAIAHYGYSREEFLSMTMRDLYPLDNIAAAIQFIQENLERPTTKVGSWQHRKHDGSMIDVEITATAPINWQGKRAKFVLLEDITERKRIEETIRNIALGVSSTTGEAFFQSLAQHLAKVLNADLVCVSELIAPAHTRVRTVATVVDGKIVANYEYDLAGTPCEQVVGKPVSIYSDQVQLQFPLDTVLVELNIESYLGASLFDSKGHTLGLISVLNRRPTSDIQLIREILQIFSVRAASELERMQAETALKRLNEQLEARVEQRTHELACTVEQLQWEMTERQQAEAALRQSEEHFRRIFDDAPIAISLMSVKTYSIVRANTAHYQLFGYSATELAAMTVADFTHPDDLQIDLDLTQQLLDHTLPHFQIEKRFFRKDGSLVWTTMTVTLFSDRDGNPLYSMAMIEDITEAKCSELERQQAEEKLRLSEASLALAQKVAHVGSWEYCPETQEHCWSEEMFRIFGLNPSHPAPNYAQLLQLIHPEDRAMVDSQNTLEQCRKTGSFQKFEHRLIRPDGLMRHVEIRGEATFNSAGEITKLYGTMLDITERQQAEAQLKASLEEKELLLKEVHHRVKNNLQVVASLFSLQSQYIDDPKVLEVLVESQNRINAMALIHEKLYQSSSLAKIDFVDYIRNLTSGLFASYSTTSNQVQLNLQIADVPLTLDTAIRCGLIINELVANSLKHAFPVGQPGEITLSFSLTPDNQMCLIIQDNGVGLPADLDLLQTNSLGLRLVRILTRKLKGTLTIHTQCGAIFQITFPKSE